MSSGVASEHIEFRSGELRFAGTLYLPEGVSPAPALVVLHAAGGGSRSHPFYRHLKSHLPQRGIAILLYDRRGSRQSDGAFETASFADLASDGAAAFDFLSARPEIDPDRIGLYRVSQGGWIAPIVAAERPRAALQIIVSGCGVTPAEQMDFSAASALREAGFAQGVIEIALDLRKRVNEYYRGGITREEILAETSRHEREPWFSLAFLDPSEDIPEDVTKDKWYFQFDHDPLPVWSRINCPTLFLFAERDRWVPVEATITRFQSVTGHLAEARFERIEAVDHMMKDLEEKEAGEVSVRYLQTMTEWLEARLGRQH